MWFIGHPESAPHYLRRQLGSEEETPHEPGRTNHVGPSAAVMNANGGPMLAMNGGFYPFDGGQHRNPKGSRRAATRRVSAMRRTFRVVVTVKLNPATIILAIAALIKVLT